MLVKELKEKLKSYGLSTVGLKQELEARLESYENELNSKDPNRVLTATATMTTALNSEADADAEVDIENEVAENETQSLTTSNNLPNTMASNETPMETTTTTSQEHSNGAIETNNHEVVTNEETQMKQEEEDLAKQEQEEEDLAKQEQEKLEKQRELEKAQAEEKLEREKQETERLEKIKQFVEQQSDLFKQIFSQTKELLNVNVCKKIEECISLNKLSLEDLNNQSLMDLIYSMSEKCVEAFDQYLTKQPEVTVTVTVADATVNMETETTNAASTEVTPTETNGEDAIVTVPKVETVEAVEAVEAVTETKVEIKPALSNVEQLIGILTEWKKANSVEEEKRQNNRRIRGRDIKKAPRPGPNEEKLKEILQRTGYTHEVSSGQRKYGGPPPNWPTAGSTFVSSQNDVKKEETTTMENPSEDTAAAVEVAVEATTNDQEKPAENGHKEDTTTVISTATVVPTVLHPGAGCECFVGKLPRDLFEDELIPVFEQQGKIWDLRLMIDPATGFSKGYCFVTYCDKENAALAAKNLNDHEIRPGKPIRVNVSVANIRLFIGNIPKTKSKEELKAEFGKIVEGLSELIIFNGGGDAAQPTDDKLKNRGFCFLEFIDHKSASVAKRKLSKFNRVLNREIAVDWADPHEEPDEETMSKVKVLYVKNLSAEVTEEQVQKLFEQYGKLERVRKMKDYAFIHFEQREDCMKAMEEQQAKVLGKNPLEISLARPLTDKKKQAQQKRNDNDHQFNRNRNSFSNGGGGGNSNWNNNKNSMAGQNGGRGGFNNRNGGGMNGGGNNRGYGGNNNNNNRNNNQRANYNNFNGNMNRGGYGGQNNNNFNNRGGGGGNFGGGGNRSFNNNNNGKMNNKRKNGGNMGGNGGGDNKKFRFNQNNNNMDNSNWNNNGQNQQISFDNQQMNGGGGDQGNNVWYQDNFNTSSQWI